MRPCRTCGVAKLPSDFYRRGGRSAHLLDTRCKVCTRADHAAHYAADPARARACSRASSRRHPGRVQAARRSVPAVRRWAYRAVNNAIRDGRLVRGACVVCGAANAQAHHPDYREPYAVHWLCAAHHRALHAGRLVLGPPAPLAVRPTAARRGELHSKAKLQAADIPVIRARYAAGWTQDRLAALYRVSGPAIHNVLHRRTWRHVA